MIQLICHLVGDYLVQSDWMAQNKSKHWWPALVHAFLYSLCFVWLCWVVGIPAGPDRVIIGKAPCITYVDKYGSETGCMNTGEPAPPLEPPVGYKVYATVGSPDRIPGTPRTPGHFRWLPWLVIFSTHFLIDRYRLARYVVWAKNWMGAKKCWYRYTSAPQTWTDDVEVIKAYRPALKADNYHLWHAPTPPLWACPTGYPPTAPVWLATFLLIVADNTLHLAINYLALRYL